MATGSIPKTARNILLFSIYLFVLVEIASRAYMVIAHNTSFFRPGDILYNYYPNLKDLEGTAIEKDNDIFDVLLLAGSVLEPGFGDVEEVLLKKLTQNTHKEVRIHNLSRLANTSLDSYYKYSELEDKHFDLVIVYHGINEVRANNAPDTVYRADYSHYNWYRQVNKIEAHPELEYLAFPFAIDYGSMKIGDLFDPPGIVPTHRPKPEWLEYGSGIRTDVSLAQNLRKIVAIANGRGEPVLLMTFVFYVPDDYSPARFASKSLDYSSHMSEIELWGKPRNVITGLLTHNKAIRDTAKESDALFVNMFELMPRGREYFQDICHLTDEGAQRFVDILFPVIDGVLSAHENAAIGGDSP